MTRKNILLKGLALLAGVFLLSTSTYSAATTYYVSNSGNDDNNGTSESTPWKTIAKVNEQAFEPGNTIKYKRGGNYSGEMIFQ